MTRIGAVKDTDREIMKPLLAEYAGAAQTDLRETREAWRRLNRLEPTRPLVWINEIPWHEMDVDGSLEVRCGDPFLRGVEQNLRRALYQWKHMRGDMVLDPYLGVGLVAGPVGCYADYGIEESVTHGTASAFESVIRTEDDVARMRKPEVWVDREETARRVAVMESLSEGVLPVRTVGIRHQWATPWDVMIRWYGIEKLYVDMYDEPELIHKLLARYMEIQHAVLDEQEALGLLEAGGGNFRVGSGGLGITDELPAPAPGEPARARHQWGCGNAQIFSEVSPDMHWEFSLKYEKPYLERFGLTYYGCCEPLHRKTEILARIGNLRKVSMSPYADLDDAAERIGRRWVLSYKPNPAVLAGESWDPDHARDELRRALAQMRGCRVEVIMKDISTVRGEPRRLWDWARLAAETVREAGA